MPTRLLSGIDTSSQLGFHSGLTHEQPRRRAITALYAFCREVDDVVDETAELQIAAAKLAWWRAEVANLYRGNPQHPVTRSLAPSIGEYSLQQEHLSVAEVKKGGSAGLKVKEHVREGDKVFRVA